MILLELYGDKNLKVKNMHKIFVGENNFDSINIQCMDSKIGDHNVSDCEFTAHVVFPDQSYLEYTLTWSETGTALIPISKDLTGTEQKLKLFIEITSSGNTLGDTSKVELTIENIVNEAQRIVTRDELIALLSNIVSDKLIYEDLGTTTESSVFDNNINPQKVYSVLYNGAGYRFFLVNGTTIQFRFSGNGIEARSTTESTWHNLTSRDTVPTENSTNLITSGAVFAALLGKLNFEEVDSSASATTFDDNIENGVLYQGYVVDNYYSWLTLAISGIPLFQFRFSGNGIELRTYDLSGWTEFKNITDDKLGFYQDTTNTKSLSDLGNMTDNSKDYLVSLKADVLYQGQSTGLVVKIINVANSQYAYTSDGKIYFRSKIFVPSEGWSSFTCIAGNS